jgi:hypothetical protein
MTVSLRLLGVPNVTVQVPSLFNDPAPVVMRKANKRFAEQGARKITLVPCRNGEGWTRLDQKKEE